MAAIALAGAVLWLACAPAAQAQEVFANTTLDSLIVAAGQVFWNSDCARPNQVGLIARRAAAGPADLTVLQSAVFSCEPDGRVWSRSVAADETAIYWIDALGRVRKGDWGGGGDQVVAELERLDFAPLAQPLIVAGGNYVFWVEHLLSFQGETIERSRVFRATKDGRSGRDLVFDLVPFAVTQLGAVGDTLFVLTTDGVLRRGSTSFDLQPVAGPGVEAFALEPGATNAFRGRIAWSRVTSPPRRVELWSAPLDQVTNSRIHFNEVGDSHLLALAFGEQEDIWFQIQRGPDGGPLWVAREGGTATAIPSLPALRHLGSSGRHLFWRENAHEIRRFGTRAPFVQLDLAATGLEAIQAVQNSNNDVPLVAGKETAVRLFVRFQAAAGVAAPLALPEPAAVLRAYRVENGVRVAPLTWFGQLAIPARGWRNVRPIARPEAPDRTNPADSLWFHLPEGWTRAGVVDLEAEVDPAHLIEELDVANNRGTRRVVFQPKEDLVLTIVPAYYQNTGLSSQGQAAHVDGYVRFGDFLQSFQGMFDRALSVLPASRLQVRWHPSVVGAGAPFRLLESKDQDRLNVSLDGLRAEYLAQHPATSPAARFCAIPPNLDYVQGGKAAGGACWWKFDLASNPGWQHNAPWAGMTMAHELAHTLSQKHVNCSAPWPDPNYPYANECWISGPLKPALGGGARDGLGWDALSGTFIRHSEASDFMGYGGPKWVSDYRWNGVFNFLGAGGAALASHAGRGGAALAGAPAWLYLRGWIAESPQAQATIACSYPVAGPLLHQLERELDGPGDRAGYELRAYDAAGTWLSFTRPLVQPTHDGIDESGLFLALIEAHPAIARMDLVRVADPGVVLATQTGGGTPPVVQVLQPAAGEVAGAVMTNRWTASDPDGHALQYVVRFSHNNGLSWLPLAVGLDTNNLVVETANLPGGSQCRLEVLASDGILAATATSEAFTVPTKPPTAYARFDPSTPPDATGGFRFGDRVVLRGLAFDAEDGQLDGERLHWVLQGPSTAEHTGERFELFAPSPGHYRAALTATDHDGNPSTAQVEFDVAPKPVSAAAGTVRLDGFVSDAAYGSDSRPLALHYDSGERAGVSVAWVTAVPVPIPRPALVFAVASLPIPVPNVATRTWVAVCIDPDRSGGGAPQVGDWCFRVFADGQTEALRGTGIAWEVAPDFIGFLARVAQTGDSWSAELAIDAAIFGGVTAQTVGFYVGHHGRHSLTAATAWPAGANWLTPQTWGAATVGDAPPANDGFANAIALPGAEGETKGTSRGATVEPGEPTDDSPAGTVWYRWQPPATGYVSLELADASFYARLWVFEGAALDSLALVAAGVDGVAPVSQATSFLAFTGRTYWVRVGGQPGGAGDFTLRWTPLPLPPATVAWYPFDGDAQDASGNARHGTVFGPTLAPDRFCRPNAAYRFSGTAGQRIELAPTEAFNPRDAFTIALWAYPTDINGWHMLFTKWDDLARRFFIHFATTGGRLQFSVSSTGTDFGEGLTDPQILPLDAWTHCVAVANRHTGELKLYRNGQLAAARAL
ncbi:MAG: LamG domain-containing protein, partial [Verrucomicrobia bacterium]|nr:LamG domain-containing protein [Verrucomicrobiota bacterium]